MADICLPCMLSDNPPKDLELYLPTKKFQLNQNLDSFCAGVVSFFGLFLKNLTFKHFFKGMALCSYFIFPLYIMIPLFDF